MINKALLIIFPIVLLLSPNVVNSQVYKQNFAHTYSIVARDKVTGEMAVAVQSHWFAVGTSVSWGKSGVGVVATQSFINPAYGPDGFQLMEEGKSATESLKILVAKDEARDVRQVAMLDVHGDVSAFTGEKCIVYANQIIGNNFSVQANMMLTDKVVAAMAKAFRESENLPIAERMIKVLKAAQKEGGDIRGKQSAALIVVGPNIVKEPWKDKIIDLRIDDHKDPITELERLLNVHHAYEFMNKGDLAVEHNDMKTALKEYGAAQKLFPENLEMKYWTAIALANN
ncbi:MAG: Zn-dependent protease, partial [Bacteroidetes bacterium]